MWLYDLTGLLDKMLLDKVLLSALRGDLTMVAMGLVDELFRSQNKDVRL
jgi:hypothetical protein